MSCVSCLALCFVRPRPPDPRQDPWERDGPVGAPPLSVISRRVSSYGLDDQTVEDDTDSLIDVSLN